MEKNNINLKIFKVIIGMSLITLGIVLSLQVNLGASPYDVFNQGIQVTLGIAPEKIGYVAFGVGCALVIIAAFVKTFIDKKNTDNFFKNISWLAILIGVGMGWMINIWYLFISVNEGQLIFLLISIYIMSLGIAMIAKQKIVADPMTTLMISIMDCGLGVVPTRIILDGSMVVLGFLLGGTVGIGTLLFLVSLGVLINFNLKNLKFL